MGRRGREKEGRSVKKGEEEYVAEERMRGRDRCGSGGEEREGGRGGR